MSGGATTFHCSLKQVLYFLFLHLGFMSCLTFTEQQQWVQGSREVDGMDFSGCSFVFNFFTHKMLALQLLVSPAVPCPSSHSGLAHEFSGCHVHSLCLLPPPNDHCLPITPSSRAENGLLRAKIWMAVFNYVQKETSLGTTINAHPKVWQSGCSCTHNTRRLASV